LENIHYFPSRGGWPMSLLHFPLDIAKPGVGGGLPYEKAASSAGIARRK